MSNEKMEKLKAAGFNDMEIEEIDKIYMHDDPWVCICTDIVDYLLKTHDVDRDDLAFTIGKIMFNDPYLLL